MVHDLFVRVDCPIIRMNSGSDRAVNFDAMKHENLIYFRIGRSKVLRSQMVANKVGLQGFVVRYQDIRY